MNKTERKFTNNEISKILKECDVRKQKQNLWIKQYRIDNKNYYSNKKVLEQAIKFLKPIMKNTYMKEKQNKQRVFLNRKLHQAWRKRNYGFTLLFDNIFKNIPTDFHHISDAFVLAIPRDIHRKNNNGDHRGKLKQIVEKLYNISYIVIENGKAIN